MGMIWEYDEKGNLVELVGCSSCIGSGYYYSALSRKTEKCEWCNGKGTLRLLVEDFSDPKKPKVVRDNLPKRVRDW